MNVSLHRFLVPALLAILLVGLVPADAEAQRRGRVVRSAVYIGVGFHPGFVYAHPWYYGHWWYPYPLYPPGRYLYRYDITASLRLQVAPRDTKVYVDGYYAGIVDDFDGFFQRLRVEPGGHEIAFELDGHRTVTERVSVAPGDDRRMRFDMEPLAPGEVAAAVTAPDPAELADAPYATGTPPEPGPPTEDARPVATGSLLLQLEPSDAEIRIDDEVHTLTADSTSLRVTLPVGEHVVRVEKTGFVPYTETIRLLRGRTLSLRVVLRR